MHAAVPDEDAEASDTRWRLLHALADGRRHRLDALSAMDGSDDSALLHRLESLRDAGMPLVLDAGGVTSPAFSPLSATTIRGHLVGTPWEVRVAYETASTNADLLARARAGHLRKPTVFAAEVQSAGRGRLGRAWRSAPGVSLTVSFAHAIDRPLSRLDGITLACGLAIRDVVGESGVRAQLKWPNDLVVDDRKLAGLLVEVHATAGTTLLVVGVGLNVLPTAAAADAPDPSALGVTDLRTAGGHEADRNVVVARFATALQLTLDRFARDGFGAFVERWNEADALRGRTIGLRAAAGVDGQGIARGVDAGGALLVDIDGTRRRVIAGDVSVRAVSMETAA